MNFKTKTVEDAYKATGREFITLPTIPGLREEDRKHLNDQLNLEVVVEAINQEANDGKPWEPNWSDTSQQKWEPWFWIDADKERPAGFGFSYTDYGYAYPYSDVGSRLCFKTKAALQHALAQFPDLYSAVILKLKPATAQA